MKLFYFSTLISILTGFKVNAQADTIVGFYDKDFISTLPDTAVYVEFSIRNLQSDSLWQTAIVNLKTKSPVLKGFYKDSSLSIASGLFQTYDDYGVKTAEGTYINNKKNGVWLMWDNNARLLDSSLYKDDSVIESDSYLYSMYDVMIQHSYFNAITKKKDVFNYSSEDGHLEDEVHYMNGDDNKHEKTYYKNGRLRTDITRQKQKIVAEHYYDTTEEEIPERKYEKLLEEIQKMNTPEFPGGINGFMSFVTDALKRDNSFQYENHGVRITATFYLDEKGEPYDINVYSESVTIRQTVLNAIHSMPKWKMHGLKFYGPVTRMLYYRIQHL